MRAGGGGGGGGRGGREGEREWKRESERERKGERERERERGGVIKGGASRQAPDVELVRDNYKFIHVLILHKECGVDSCTSYSRKYHLLVSSTHSLE